MQHQSDSTQILSSRGAIAAEYPVLESREIDGFVVVIYDHMAFPQGDPARNLFAYSASSGQLAWRANGIGAGATDAYTNILSERPLTIGNFAGYSCIIELGTGEVLVTAFTK